MKRIFLFSAALISALSLMAQTSVENGTPFDGNCGSTITLTATANPKSHFVEWQQHNAVLGKGTQISTNPTLQVDPLSKDTDVDAIFMHNDTVRVLVYNQNNPGTPAYDDVAIAYMEETNAILGTAVGTHITEYIYDTETSSIAIKAKLEDECSEFIKWQIDGVDVADTDPRVATGTTESVLTLDYNKTDSKTLYNVVAVYDIKVFQVTVHYDNTQGGVTR